MILWVRSLRALTKNGRDLRERAVQGAHEKLAASIRRSGPYAYSNLILINAIVPLYSHCVVATAPAKATGRRVSPG